MAMLNNQMVYIYMLVATPTARASPIAHPFCHLAMKVPPDTAMIQPAGQSEHQHSLYFRSLVSFS